MIITKALKMFIHESKKAYKKYILKDPFLIDLGKWYSDNGDEKLRYEYNLNQDSIIFDVGGYEGEFAENIFKKYQSTIFIFEPVKSFFEIIESKFRNNSKIKSFRSGLSNKNTTAHITLEKDASSVVKASSSSEEIKLIDIKEFILDHNIQKIDLIKINIEGGEYDVLERLIDMDYLKNCTNLQIQFHDFFPEAKERREKIRSILSKTHKCTYEYYFVWENWELIQ